MSQIAQSTDIHKALYFVEGRETTMRTILEASLGMYEIKELKVEATGMQSHEEQSKNGM